MADSSRVFVWVQANTHTHYKPPPEYQPPHWNESQFMGSRAWPVGKLASWPVARQTEVITSVCLLSSMAH